MKYLEDLFLDKTHSMKETLGEEGVNEALENGISNLQETEKHNAKRFAIMLGRPNCGKSALINRFLNQNKQNIIPIKMNLRGFNLRDKQDFYDMLAATFTNFLLNMINNAPKQILDEAPKLLFAVYGIDIKMKPFEIYAKLSENPKFNSLQEFQKLFKLYHSFKQDHLFKRRNIVFFIDEANALKQLKNECPKDLVDFFRFIVKVTKEERLIDVILGTTDSFFTFFLEDLGVQSEFYEIITIDHLK